MANTVKPDLGLRIATEQPFRRREIVGVHLPVTRVNVDGDEFAIVQTAVGTRADVTDLVERVFDAIRELMKPPDPPKKAIGFRRS